MTHSQLSPVSLVDSMTSTNDYVDSETFLNKTSAQKCSFECHNNVDSH